MGKKGTAGGGKSAAKEGGQSTQENKEDPAIVGNFICDVPLLCGQRGLSVIEILRKGETTNSPRSFMVETEDADPDTVTAIHMRGWLLTEDILALVTDALASCATLVALHFWNVGFHANVLNGLVQLSVDHHIREISLDGNLLAVDSIILLLNQRRLEKLSMKSCNIDDEMVQCVAETLTDNSSLLHLNLSCNHISDIGCMAIANCLRLNRTLSSLVLTSNRIQDTGAISLAKILSQFVLSHEEVVQQRRLEAKRRLDEHFHEIHSDKRTASPHSRSPSSLATDKSKGKGDKSAGNKLKKGDAKKDEKTKKEDKSKKVSDVKKPKMVKDGKAKKSNSAEPVSDSPLPETSDVVVNPLLSDQLLKKSDGWYLMGNLNLLYLGLAYNEIGQAGCHSLLRALQEQNKFLDYGTGILRLSLKNNIPKINGYQCHTNEDQDVLSDIEKLLMDRMKTLEELKISAAEQNL